jgi:hypothetical protein
MTGILVGVPLAVYVAFWLHGVREVAILVGAGVGLAVALLVGTRSDAGDTAADAAWREVAPDLPPASDRTALERSQEKLPGPEKDRRTSSRSADRNVGSPSSRAGPEGAEPR